jgi:hypothetical protein
MAAFRGFEICRKLTVSRRWNSMARSSHAAPMAGRPIPFQTAPPREQARDNTSFPLRRCRIRPRRHRAVDVPYALQRDRPLRRRRQPFGRDGVQLGRDDSAHGAVER